MSRFSWRRYCAAVDGLISAIVCLVTPDRLLGVKEGGQDLRYDFGEAALPNMLLPGANHYT
jgi:hypothetical protein